MACLKFSFDIRSSGVYHLNNILELLSIRFHDYPFGESEHPSIKLIAARYNDLRTSIFAEEIFFSQV